MYKIKQKSSNMFHMDTKIDYLFSIQAVGLLNRLCWRGYTKRMDIKKGYLHRQPIFVNLKSNTMKNTVQI